MYKSLLNTNLLKYNVITCINYLFNRVGNSNPIFVSLFFTAVSFSPWVHRHPWSVWVYVWVDAGEVWVSEWVSVCVCVRGCSGVMYSPYQGREELEDDLYQEEANDDSDGSEAYSEVEFRLYSQLHYSSNAGEMEDRGETPEDQDSQQPEVTVDADGDLVDTEDCGLPSSEQQLLKKKKVGEKRDKQKKGKSDPKGQRSSSVFEEVIVIDSSPDVISISEDDTADDEGVCVMKGQGLHRLQTSTPTQQVEDESDALIAMYVDVFVYSPGHIVSLYRLENDFSYIFDWFELC